MNFTKEEKAFMKMLLQIGERIIESQDGYLDFNGRSFSSNDLFELKVKLDIDI